MLDHPNAAPSPEDAPAAPARPAGDAGVTRLPRLALRVWQATTCATALPIAAVLAAVALWWDHPVGGPVLWILVALTAAVALADLAVVNRVRHRSYSYTVDEDEVYIAKGALVRHTVDVAVPQVLSVHVVRGPLQRALGLATVRFVSVVDAESLGPVELAVAQRVKEVVLRGLAARRQESATALVAAGEVAP